MVSRRLCSASVVTFAVLIFRASPVLAQCPTISPTPTSAPAGTAMLFGAGLLGLGHLHRS
jgi:hypothetical protein